MADEISLTAFTEKKNRVYGNSFSRIFQWKWCYKQTLQFWTVIHYPFTDSYVAKYVRVAEYFLRR